MKSGIYSISNTINGKLYVGSTNNISVRWNKHRALLRHNKHQNTHLQSAWNKYGEESFEFSIIEECSIESLIEREQYFIDKLGPEYNQTKVAGKVEMTSSRRKKLSDSVSKAYQENRIVRMTKRVYQYDLKGNYIGEFNSLKEASKVTGVDTSHLSNVLNDKQKVAGGYVWRFYKVDKLDIWFNSRGRPLIREPHRPKNKKIVLINNNESLIFKSAKEVSEQLGCTTNQVYHSLKRGSLLLNKYKVERRIL